MGHVISFCAYFSVLYQLPRQFHVRVLISHIKLDFATCEHDFFKITVGRYMNSMSVWH